jgi:hypothetical protein
MKRIETETRRYARTLDETNRGQKAEMPEKLTKRIEAEKPGGCSLSATKKTLPKNPAFYKTNRS